MEENKCYVQEYSSPCGKYKVYFKRLNGLSLKHREDGPAVEHENGTKEWYKNGYLHRENGPAIEYVNGVKCWYINGKLHREDGPVIEYGDSDTDYRNKRKRHYYINGLSYDKVDYDLVVKQLKQSRKVTSPEVIKETEFSDIFDKGLSSERKVYFKDSMRTMLHRVGKPAVEYVDGSKYWYQDNLLHREDGAAMELSDGSRFYFIKGVPYNDKTYWAIILKNKKIEDTTVQVSKMSSCIDIPVLFKCSDI